MKLLHILEMVKDLPQKQSVLQSDSSNLRHIIKIPEWLQYMAPNALISTQDVADLFNITTSTVGKRIKNGYLPPAEKRINSTHYWTAKTIRVEYKKFLLQQIQNMATSNNIDMNIK